MADGKLGLAVTSIPPGNILLVKSTNIRAWSIKLGGGGVFLMVFCFVFFKSQSTKYSLYSYPGVTTELPIFFMRLNVKVCKYSLYDSEKNLGLLREQDDL